MTMRDEIAKVLEQAKSEIQANMVAKNINASGRTSAAFAVVSRAYDISLILGAGNHAPLDTLEIGRPAGNVPGGFRTTKAGVRDVSNVFKYMLIKWAEEKGFQLGWGGATMLGRRIAEKGTLRHSHHENVYSAPVAVAVQRIREMTKTAIMTTIHNTNLHF